jgi:hypothetical protein
MAMMELHTHCKKVIFGLSLLLIVSTGFARLPLQTGLVLNFPTVSASVKDASGKKNNGRAQFLVVSNSQSLVSMQQTHQLTYCMWIKPNSITPEFPVLLSKGGNQQPGAYGGYEIILNANGDHDLLFVSGGYGAGSGGNLINNNLGQWIHVAFTIDTVAETVQFYVNGQPTDTTTQSGGFADINFDLPNNLYIGAPDPAANGNRTKFDGDMKQVMLFNRALTAQEVHDIFSKTGPKILK